LGQLMMYHSRGDKGAEMAPAQGPQKKYFVISIPGYPVGKPLYNGRHEGANPQKQGGGLMGHWQKELTGVPEQLGVGKGVCPWWAFYWVSHRGNVGYFAP